MSSTEISPSECLQFNPALLADAMFDRRDSLKKHIVYCLQRVAELITRLTAL